MKFTLQPYLRYLFCLVAMPFFVACGGDVAREEGEVLVDSDSEIGTEYGSEINTFSTWDADRDSYLSEQEWGTGWGSEDNWNTWDLNDDNYLDNNEFGTAFGQSRWYNNNLYSEWDADLDSRIGRDEWNTGLWNTWYVDRDSRIGANEYDESLFE